MGLLKAAFSSISSTLKDQYKDYYYCESLPNHVLIKKGQRHDTKAGSNHALDNVISDGSTIVVNAGQALLVVENGKVIDISLEEGVYTWQTGTTPSIFTGNLPTSIKESIKDMISRITYGGEPARDQRVYYVNIKEIINNKFGSSSPVSYRDPVYLAIYIRYYGIFSFKILNPVLFYTNIAGNVEDEYTTDQMIDTCYSEFYSALDSVLSNFGDGGLNLQFNEIPRKQEELSTRMETMLDEDWLQKRGMLIISVGIDKVTPDEKSQAKIDKRDEDLFKRSDSQFYGEQQTASKGLMTQAGAEALVEAAKNESGALNGGIGVGVISGLQSGNTGGIAGAVVGNSEPIIPHDTNNVWICSNCQNQNTGKFCSECGTKKPEEQKAKYCSECGTKITLEKFCPNCGHKI